MEAGGRPGWLRALFVVLGILAIILGILVLVFPAQLGIPLIVILFGIGLILVAIFAIVIAAQSGLPGWVRALSLIFGVFVIGLVIAAIIIGGQVLVFIQVLLLAVGLALLGVRAIAFEGTDTSLAGWARGLAIVLGVLAIIFAILMIVNFDLGEAILLIYFAVGLFVTGIGAIVAGVVS